MVSLLVALAKTILQLLDFGLQPLCTKMCIALRAIVSTQTPYTAIKILKIYYFLWL